MRTGRRHALFHAIVTMGAASVQGGCGGVTTDTAARGDHTAGTGGAGGGAHSTAGAGANQSAATGGSHSFFIEAGGATPIGGFGNAGAATATGGAAAGGASVGAGGVTAQPSSGGATSISTDAGFSTDAGTAPITAPEQCAHSEQFQCASWDPAPTNCSCDLNAPVSQADCPPCFGFFCHSYAPNVGCSCVACIR